MGVPLWIVDAFASRAFSGNPAAVCWLVEPRSDDWLQAVAAEMNLSETAFAWPEADAYRLRWFTPTVEVDLCGHATLACSFVLWETGRCPLDRLAVFATRSGRLAAERVGDEIALDFPAFSVRPTEAPVGLSAALGVAPRFVGTTGMDLFCELADPDELTKLRPDMAALARLAPRGVVATCAARDGRHDFLSRFFAPAAGIPEDPVTGSAHCALGPYWGERLGKTELLGYQASARGGEVGVEVRGDRARLIGRATLVARGELLV